jgi:predicted nucleic acid-binding Zn ribbon protein
MMEPVETKLAVHEAVCAERYRSIEDKLDRGKERMRTIEYLIYIVIAAVLFGPGVAAEFVKKILGL